MPETRTLLWLFSHSNMIHSIAAKSGLSQKCARLYRSSTNGKSGYAPTISGALVLLRHYAYSDDVCSVKLLVPHRRGISPKHTQRKFLLYRRFLVILLELTQPVLHILLVAGPSNKLKGCYRSFAGGQHHQLTAGLPFLFFRVVIR